MDTLVPVNTTKVCRSCMRDGSDKNTDSFELHSIYDQIQNIKIYELLNMVIPKLPKIEIMDSLPKQICTDCFENLKICYDFQNKCLNADHQLRNPVQSVVFAIENIKQDAADPLQSMADATIKQENEEFDEFINIMGAENEMMEIYEVKEFEETAEEVDPTENATAMDLDNKVKVDNKPEHEKKVESSEPDIPKIKRYACEFCCSTYTENKNLQRHIRSKHSTPNQADQDSNMKNKLIEVVQMFPCLYDRNDSQYRNKYAMDKAWNSVASATGETVSECQIHWRSLRDAYVRQLEISKGKSEVSNERKRKWRYMDAMSFLQNHIETRYSHIVDEVNNVTIKLEDNDEFTAEIDHSTTPSSQESEVEVNNQSSSNETSIKAINSQDNASVNPSTTDGPDTYEMWECKTCLQLFYHKKNLIRHMKNQHGEVISKNVQVVSEFTDITKLSTIIKCDECDRIFHKQSAYNLHKFYHKSAGASKTCKFCDKSFKGLEKLIAHERSHASEKPNHLCPDCGKTYGSVDSLQQHRLRHTGEKNFECNFCPKKFFANSDLRGHIRQVHNKQRPFVCEICGAGFKRPNCLRNHTLVHTGEKRYRCEYCSKGFTSGDNLRRHVRSHTGEKPCKCEYCPRSFKSTSDLKKHLTKHIGVNIYRCELCPAAFPLARDLRAHFASHKDDDEETKVRNKRAWLEAEEQLKLKIKETVVDNVDDENTMEESTSNDVGDISMGESISNVVGETAAVEESNSNTS